MMNIEILPDNKIAIIEPSDDLEQSDFKRLDLIITPYINEHGKLNGLLIDAGKFSGWNNLKALLSHIKFINQRHTQVQRIAMLADNNLKSWLPKILDKFVDAEVRHFSLQEREPALAWLKTGATTVIH